MHRHTIEPTLIRPRFVELVQLLIPNLVQPATDEEALNNYIQILDAINNHYENNDESEQST